MKRYRVCLLLAAFFLPNLGCHHKTEPHSVTLNWSAPAGAEVVSYNVYRRIPGAGFVKLAQVPAPPYEDRLVLSGNTYYYAVTAIDKSGHESRFSVPTQTAIP
jgi:fibronectin type 3 domain-containing protein